jgi:hypothetical protein
VATKTINWREHLAKPPAGPPPPANIVRTPTEDDLRRAQELVEKLGLEKLRDSKR